MIEDFSGYFELKGNHLYNRALAGTLGFEPDFPAMKPLGCRV